MEQLKEFMEILCGEFDNRKQYERKQKEGDTKFPFAEHTNTACNDKIKHLPEDFKGIFLIEESDYTVEGKTHSSPHLFLFTEEEKGIRLTSYELPEGVQKENFRYKTVREMDYSQLKASEKFTPALYVKKDGAWEGGSVSHFTPVLTFTLWERFSREELVVSECMHAGEKQVFGYDEPIVYQRKVH